MYQPSSEDTREAYQALLSLVEQQLGGYPSVIIQNAANEVLSFLKYYEKIRSPPELLLLDEKTEIEKLLSPIPDHIFEQLVLISGRITDYIFQDAAESSCGDQNGFYQPTTEKTRVAYKLLLDVVQGQLGRHQDCDDDDEKQNQIVVHCMVAHEILLILKNNSVKHEETRREMIEKQLNPVPDHTYNFLVFIGKIIQDFEGRWDGDALRVGAEIKGTSSSMEETGKIEDGSEVVVEEDHRHQKKKTKQKQVAEHKGCEVEGTKKSPFMKLLQWIRSKSSAIFHVF